MLQQPLRWEGGEPTDDERQQVIDDFANLIAREVLTLSGRRLKDERRAAWRVAFTEAGVGSTFRRARVISSDIYDRAAPVPNVTPSPDQNTFLHEVTSAVEAVSEDAGVNLV